MAHIHGNTPLRSFELPRASSISNESSRISKIAQSRLQRTSDNTGSNSPLDSLSINNNISDKTIEKTSKVTENYFRPRSLPNLRKLAIFGDNKYSQQPGDFENFLRAGKYNQAFRMVEQNPSAIKEAFIKAISSSPPNPSLKDAYLEFLKKLISRVKDTGILKEILDNLIDKKLFEDISCFFYDKQSRALLFEILPGKEIEKKIPPENLYDILDKLIKHTPEDEISVEIFEKLSKRQLFHSFAMFEKIDQIENLRKILPFLNPSFLGNFLDIALKNNRSAIFALLTDTFADKIDHLRDYFLEKIKEQIPIDAKEKILSILINFLYKSFSLKDIENLRNASLDIGKRLNPNLIDEGLKPQEFWIFVISTFFPSITKKILEGSPTSTISITAEEIKKAKEEFGPSARLFTKIISLLSNPIDALKQLEPITENDIRELPSIKPKHRQYSGSCVLKNLNSLLSMSFDAPSVIIRGGWPQHTVYMEVFKGEKDQFFCLLHNLGAASEWHPQSEGKIYPVPLYFNTFKTLENFLQLFIGVDREDYLKSLGGAHFIKDNLNEFRSNRINHQISSALTRHPQKPRENKAYNHFRTLQKKVLKEMSETMGSSIPREDILKAVVLRTNIKKTK